MADLRAIPGGGEDDDRRKDVRAAIDEHVAPALVELENALAEDRMQHVREFALQIRAATDWILELIPEEMDGAAAGGADPG